MISQRAVRVVFIVMRERCCKVLQCCSHIRFWHERDIVFFHRFHEPFGHAITLRAAHRCCAGLQIQLSLRTSAFHTRYTLNRCPSATAPLYRATCRRSAFPQTSASHPVRSNCHSLPCLLPSLASRSQQSSANVTCSFAVVAAELEAI